MVLEYNVVAVLVLPPTRGVGSLHNFLHISLEAACFSLLRLKIEGTT
jgi:hypothetical protein